jgi:hypothetical protein
MGANQYVVPGSRAMGIVGSTAEVGMEGGHNFIASRTDFHEPVIAIVSANVASVDITYSAWGHDADVPSLRPRESDHEVGPFHMHIEMQEVGGRWLVNAFS